MSRLWKYLLIAAVITGLLLPVTLLAIGCGGGTTTTAATETTVTKTTTTESGDALAERADKVFAADSAGYAGNAIAPDKLSAMMADPAQMATLYLLDVRSADDYAKGHIEGAVNVPFATWAAPDSLSTYPKDDKTIVVICYTGHTAAEEVGGLRMLGYNAIALKGGMMGWTQSPSSDKVVAGLQGANNPVVMTPPAPPAATTTSSGPLTKPSDDLYQSIASKANTVMSIMPTSGDYANFVITADTLKTKLADPAEMAKLYLLDIRSADDYQTVGHIEGAMNIPFKDMGVAANLMTLPKDKKIVVICYTGNTAAQTAMILNVLGYDAAVLKYGSMSWTVTPNTDGYVQMIQNANYPVVQ
jgi:rhodanese-related sulfurtransferase